MKRLILAAALCLTAGLFASACDDGPSEPSGYVDPTFRATLSPANEVPPVANAEAGATGTMDITINTTRDGAGTITAATVSFNGTLASFPAGTAITAAHIHTGVAGTNGGFIVNLGLTPGEITLANGSGAIVKNNITVTADLANQIITNPAAFYFNAHTALNPGGAVRGQLVRTN
jgi:hypothetical protein